MFYVYNPILQILPLSRISRISGADSSFFSSLPILFACCTILAALMPSILIMKEMDVVIPKLIVYIGFACACLHASLGFSSFSHPAVDYQIRAFVCAFQLHAAVHLLYHCMKDGKFASFAVYASGIALVYCLGIILPISVWTTMARSPQDILMIHALAAFCPEVLGTFFDTLVGIVRKLLD